jgi:hypothetical protein
MTDTPVQPLDLALGRCVEGFDEQILRCAAACENAARLCQAAAATPSSR